MVTNYFVRSIYIYIWVPSTFLTLPYLFGLVSRIIHKKQLSLIFSHDKKDGHFGRTRLGQEEKANWDFALTLPERGDELDKTTVKGSQFQKPFLEFSALDFCLFLFFFFFSFFLFPFFSSICVYCCYDSYVYIHICIYIYIYIFVYMVPPSPPPPPPSQKKHKRRTETKKEEQKHAPK